MILAPREYPLSLDAALLDLRDALGDNYGAATDDATLTRALSRDAVQVAGQVHPRPWATAARLIRMNTEYEVTDGLQAKIDRKLAALDAEQCQADAAAGIAAAVAALEGEDDAERWLQERVSYSVRSEATY